MLALVTGGLAWWSSDRGNGHVDAGPAGHLDPIVVEESGIWRLPADDSGFEVASVIESSFRYPLQIAVDDVEAPTQLLAVSPAGRSIADIPGAGPPSEFTESTTYSLLHGRTAEDPSWLEVTGDGRTGFLSFGYIGLTDAEVMDVARDLVLEIGDTAGALTDTERVRVALERLVPPVELVPVWDPATVGRWYGVSAAEDGPASTVTLRTAASRDGDEINVSLTHTGLPRPVATLWRQVDEAGQLVDPAQALPESVLRPDLGPGVMVESLGDLETALVTTDDGVEIRVARVRLGPATASGVTPLTLVEQLTIIDSLRSMDETEFWTEVDRRGIDVLDRGYFEGSESGPTTTTMNSGGS